MLRVDRVLFFGGGSREQDRLLRLPGEGNESNIDVGPLGLDLDHELADFLAGRTLHPDTRFSSDPPHHGAR